jgi:hypothetical protein
MFEGKGDGEDVDKVMEGDNRCGVEDPTDLMEGCILCNSQRERERLMPPGGEVPDGGTIGEDGEDDGIEDLPLVGEGEASNGVP